MDRQEYIRSLRLGGMNTQRIEAFVRGLPRRVPQGDDDDSAAVRQATEGRLAELNAQMLGRDYDARVPVDLDEMVATVADRMDRYTSADWSRNNVLERARTMVGEIAADLHRVAAPEDDDDRDDEE
jgi:hypothetical protein